MRLWYCMSKKSCPYLYRNLLWKWAKILGHAVLILTQCLHVQVQTFCQFEIEYFVWFILTWPGYIQHYVWINAWSWSLLTALDIGIHLVDHFSWNWNNKWTILRYYDNRADLYSIFFFFLAVHPDRVRPVANRLIITAGAYIYPKKILPPF